jgi:hypothetical protein
VSIAIPIISVMICNYNMFIGKKCHDNCFGKFSIIFKKQNNKTIYLIRVNLVFIYQYEMHFCILCHLSHWGKADDHNCNYGHPKMAVVESGKNVFCRLNCFYNVF